VNTFLFWLKLYRNINSAQSARKPTAYLALIRRICIRTEKKKFGTVGVKQNVAHDMFDRPSAEGRKCFGFMKL
jgi:hypothetical protein